MKSLLFDLRSSVRLIRKSPGSSVVAICTLALAIGATAAMFSVLDGVLLKPLPVKDQNRLLVVWTSIPERGFNHWPFSFPQYEGLRERLRTVSGAAAHPYSGTLPAVLHLDGGTAMPLKRTAVSGEWFDVAGVHPRAGRLLTRDDDHVGSPRVVVLSSGIARRLFGHEESALGRRLRIDEDTFTVVGVAPAEFEYPRTAEAWVPAVWFRDSPYVAWDVLVRVAPGFTTEQTIADLTSALHSLPPDPEPVGGMHAQQIVHAQTIAQDMVGDVRPGLLMLGASVLLMLVVAGINVGNLLIARGLARQQELSLRAAIGASRVRLLRELAVEATVLASIGGVLAVVVAYAALKALLANAPAELPRMRDVQIDGRTLVFTLFVAIVVAIIFGTLPAFRAVRAEPADALRSARGSTVQRSHGLRVRDALVIGQIAITILVIWAAGLLVGSLQRIERLDPGFAVPGLFLAEVALPQSGYPNPAAVQRAMVRLAEHASGLSGIRQATAVTSEPFAGTQGVDASIFAEGQLLDESARPIVNYEGVDGSYFATVGLPILRGRAIDRRDREGTQPIVVVNETFARLFWPGKDPIGRRIKWGSAASANPWLTVVGLAGDTRYRELTSIRPTIYVPYAHGIPVSPGYLMVRSSDPAFVSGAIRRAVANQEPAAVIVRIEPLSRLLAAPIARPRFQSTLAACFATLALLLAMVGTYGVLSFVVSQRRREIGIRMAVGATPSHVRHLVFTHGFSLGAFGVVLGVACAIAVRRLVQPVLFGISASDPFVLASTAALLLMCVAAAMLFPTRTAVRTDPLVVLRSE